MIAALIEAHDLYTEYTHRVSRLEVLREYAKNVIKATGGPGKTPVEPLATMGKHGGPLLCDVCKKPMILEGGGYQGVYADEGWRRNPTPNWLSFISGGMLLVTESNGTLRIYHGHPYGDGCVGQGDRDLDSARAEFERTRVDNYDKLDMIEAYLRAEAPEMCNDETLSKINTILFRFDPGPGVNTP